MHARRRSLVLGIAAALAAPGAAAQGRDLPRVAIVFNGERDAQKRATESFVRGMRDQGYVDGRNVRLDMRYAGGSMEALPGIVRDAIASAPRVIVLSGSQAAWAGRKASATVPIVMAGVGDPVGQGLIASLRRPGRNLTGLALMSEVVAAKRLELLREALPKATRVARLYNSSNPAVAQVLKAEADAASRIGIELLSFDARTLDELDRALAAIAAARPHAVTVSEDALFASHGPELVGRFTQERIPSIYGWPQFVALGGLMSYAADTSDQFARAASYVHRILQGENPAELPVEQATRFELYINQKAAGELGVSLPRSLLLRANLVD